MNTKLHICSSFPLSKYWYCVIETKRDTNTKTKSMTNRRYMKPMYSVVVYYVHTKLISIWSQMPQKSSRRFSNFSKRSRCWLSGRLKNTRHHTELPSCLNRTCSSYKVSASLHIIYIIQRWKLTMFKDLKLPWGSYRLHWLQESSVMWWQVGEGEGGVDWCSGMYVLNSY